MTEEKLINIQASELHQLTTQKLMAAGLPKAAAEETANHVLYADLGGFHSHGVVRVEYYAERIAKGGVNTNPQLKFENTAASTAIFHGDNGQGHFVVNESLKPAMKMAKENGCAVVGISKVSHTGTMSYYLKKIVDNDLIGISITNSDPMVVPYGGSEIFYGTNPIGFGAPSADKARPIIFDMATTVQAWGKILDARSKGNSIPNTWAVDAKGNPTTNPDEVAGLLPIAGPKGYGLMMMVDILTAVMLGLPNGKHVSSMYTDLSAGRDLGHTFILIDPKRFVGLEAFKAAILKTQEELHAIKPASDFKQVYYPGELFILNQEKHLQNGIDVPEEIIKYLQSDVIHRDRYDGLSTFAK